VLGSEAHSFSTLCNHSLDLISDAHLLFDDPTGGLKLDRHNLEIFLQGETWHPWYLLWISEWLCKTLCINFAQNFLQQAWEVKFQRKLDSWSRGILPWVEIFLPSPLSPLLTIA
jgi:hypothetical protein